MRAAKVDENQSEIVEAFRRFGFTVHCLHTVGRGVPDLLCGKYGINLLVEVKTMKGELTPDQKHWHSKWRGDIHIVRNVDDVMAVFNEMTARKKESDS